MTGGFGKRVKNWSNGTDRLQRNEAWRERLSPAEAAAVIGNAGVRYTVQLLRRQDVCDRPRLLGRQRRAAERFVRRIRKATRLLGEPLEGSVTGKQVATRATSKEPLGATL